MARIDHINDHRTRIIVCNYCSGSGQQIEYLQNKPDKGVEPCPKCKGHKVLIQHIHLTTEPISAKYIAQFRKVILD